MSKSKSNPDPNFIRERVIERAAELALTSYAIAHRVPAGGVSEDAVRAYLTRRRSLESSRLAHVLRVLGLTVAVE